jgi:hypothetical protein
VRVIRALALAVVLAVTSTVAAPTTAAAASPTAVTSAHHSAVTGTEQVQSVWVLIGWYPTLGECTRAAAAYAVTSCTPHDGGWMLYAYKSACGGKTETATTDRRKC